MAKTLVALYDTFTDAERVVQELIEDGFARSISISLLITPRAATLLLLCRGGLRVRGSQPT